VLHLSWSFPHSFTCSYTIWGKQNQKCSILLTRHTSNLFWQPICNTVSFPVQLSAHYERYYCVHKPHARDKSVHVNAYNLYSCVDVLASTNVCLQCCRRVRRVHLLCFLYRILCIICMFISYCWQYYLHICMYWNQYNKGWDILLGDLCRHAAWPTRALIGKTTSI
jgi:hypothetical protein